jgi:hypothetical protein
MSAKRGTVKTGEFKRPGTARVVRDGGRSSRHQAPRELHWVPVS